MRKYALPAALLGGVMSCSDLPTAPLTQQQLSSPSSISRDMSHVPIPGQYIVRFRTNGANALSNAMVVSNLYGGTVDRVYTSAINGAAMHLADDAAAALRADSRVLSVEQDEVIRMSATTQMGATWGLDRLDQRTRPLGGSYLYGASGNGVTVYILDTGINFGQADFGGRAQTGYDAITQGGTAADCEGHGSHVAGTVGSNTYGVAKNVRLVAVRVLDCQGNGSSSSVLAGIDWVTTHKALPAVANMSIGAGFNATVNQAVQNSIAAGITYTVSAGNYSTDACMQSPASAPDALTIGATDAGDGFASFSNFGTCVDILAPGVNITSWWTGSGSPTLSGTSMSAPHVAGAAALYLQVNPTATPAQVRAALIGNATSGLVSGVPSGTPNLLLYTGFIQAPSAPVANFMSSCVAVACSFDAGSSTSSWGTPSYQWTFGDASNGSGKTPTHTYAAPGTYAVKLTITDPNGTNSKTANVVINRAPTAAIASPANNASFAQGAPITFAGTGTDPEDGALSGASLVWSSNQDGVIGTGASLSTTALSLGSHTVTLTAKDAQNATSTATVAITVVANQAPTATIATPANNTVYPVGTNATFSGAGNDAEDGALTGSSLVWTSTRDGQIGTGVSFSTSTLTTGAHTITLTAKDARGATATATRSITIGAGNQPPVARFTASCPTSQCTLDASGSTDNAGVVKYAWTWGDGRSENKTQPVARNTWALHGLFTITLTVTDAGGLTNSISKQIAVPDLPPVATIVAPVGGSVFPQGAPVTFTGSATDFEDGALAGAALVWSSSVNGQLGSGTSISTSVLAPGSHIITLTATDALGVLGTATRTISITANQSPTATIATPANNATYLLGSSVSFAGAGSDPEDGALTGASLAWTSSRDGQIGTSTSFSTTALSIGVHAITLTAKDANNATATATRNITVTSSANVPPVARFTMTCPVLNCVADASTSTDDAGVVSYSWDWGNGKGKTVTSPTTTTTFSGPGIYTVTLTVRDVAGLTNTIVKQIPVGNQPPSAVIATPANNASFTQGAIVTLTGSATDPESGALTGTSLAWTSSRDGAIGAGTTVSTSSLSVGTHTILLIATDAQAAKDTATVTIAIIANQPPTATISAPTKNANFPVGTSVSFSGAGNDLEDGTLGGASLVWTSSRDGQIGTGTNFTKSNLATGVHTITLTAKDAKNVTAAATRVITITASNRPPEARFTLSCAALACAFDASSSTDDQGIVLFSWTWGDGTKASSANATASHTFGAPGPYTITLIVKDAKNAMHGISRLITVP